MAEGWSFGNEGEKIVDVCVNWGRSEKHNLELCVLTIRMKVTICREAHFNAAHRLHNPHWTDEQNRAVFGKCNSPNYHGHNYDLIVKVKGPVDEATGYVMDMKLLADLVDEVVVGRFDHKNLNLDTEFFRTLNPTAENIVIVCWNLLRARIDASLDLTLVLYETQRNFVEYSGE